MRLGLGLALRESAGFRTGLARRLEPFCPLQVSMVNFVLDLWETCQQHTGRPYLSSSATLNEVFAEHGENESETMIGQMVSDIAREFGITTAGLHELAKKKCAALAAMKKSAVYNFGVGDLKLCDFAAELDASYTQLGPITRSLLEQLFAEKMAAGFSTGQAKSYLAAQHGLPAGRVDAIMLRLLLKAPVAEQTTVAASQAFVDTVAADYASAHKVSLSSCAATADLKISALTTLQTLISLKLHLPTAVKPNKNMHLSEKNDNGYTAITLAANEGTSEMMEHIFNKLMTTQWVYGPVTCKVLPLEGIDYIHTKQDEKSVMEILVESDRLELFTLRTVQDLITRKWDKYAEALFTNRLVTVAVYMIIFTFTELMPEFSDPSVPMFAIAVKIFGWFVITVGAGIKAKGEMEECRDSGGIVEHFSPKRACFMENVTSAGFLVFLALSILGAQFSELVSDPTLSSVFKQAGDISEALAALFGWTNVYVSAALLHGSLAGLVCALFGRGAGLAGTRICCATRLQASSQSACSTCLHRT
jgi:hypothetical protein